MKQKFVAEYVAMALALPKFLHRFLLSIFTPSLVVCVSNQVIVSNRTNMLTVSHRCVFNLDDKTEASILKLISN